MARRIAQLGSEAHPRYVVWELTLKCDLACRHCGSRAGRPRAEELSVDEALALVDELAAMGTQEIVFIGGEAYLNPDWLQIVRATAAAGITAKMTTGARALDADLARAAAEAGLSGVSVSVDGLEATHDELRAVPGSWRAAMAALDHIADAGMTPFANTQLNRRNQGELEALADLLIARGIRAWQVQITGPMGRAADREDWLLQPYDLLTVVPRLAAVARRSRAAGCQLEVGNNLGYYGPHEADLRSAPWQGCHAGTYLLGIESNGDIKGCPSMPSAPYVGGNVRQTSLQEIWTHADELRVRRDDRVELWGHCRGCYYAEVCRGGCTWTSHTLLGKPGNMPYCYHRAETLAARGIRERVRLVEAAPGTPFDFGRYALVEEPLP